MYKDIVKKAGDNFKKINEESKRKERNYSKGGIDIKKDYFTQWMA